MIWPISATKYSLSNDLFLLFESDSLKSVLSQFNNTLSFDGCIDNLDSSMDILLLEMDLNLLIFVMTAIPFQSFDNWIICTYKLKTIYVP